MNSQTPARLTGSASMSFQNPVYVVSCASVVGKKEGEGPLGSKFDLVCEEPMFGEDTWEAAESTMQKEAAALALGKAGLTPGDIRMTFAGDLLAQTTASSFGIAGMGIPFYGLFGACSTIGESLSLGAMSAAAGYGEHILCATSSHFASAEKEFRFPLAYGNQRPLSATWTVTGSGACVLSGTLPVPEIPEKTESLISEEGCVQITGLTTGRLIDFGLKDSLNMGGCMAPAACDTIYRNFCDFGRAPDDYDAIFTGDLGAVGKRILLDLLNEKGYDIESIYQDCGLLIFDGETQDSLNMGGCMAPAACDTIYRNFCDFGRAPDDYDAIFTGDLGAVGKRILLDLLNEKGYDIESIYQDCGLLIFDGETQDTHSGGSGCGCSASVLAAYILPELAKGTWKRVLFVPTGALLSKTSFNEGDSIPGIAHAVVLEHVSKKDQKQ